MIFHSRKEYTEYKYRGYILLVISQDDSEPQVKVFVSRKYAPYFTTTSLDLAMRWVDDQITEIET